MKILYTYHRRYRGPLRAVILDWAGTVMDYGCYAPAVVFIEVFKRRGVPITMEEARAPMGAHKRVHIEKITQMESVAQRFWEIHGRLPTDDDVEEMFQDFVPLQLDCLADYAELIPGTLEALEEFRRRGMKIGSTTGYTREMMELLLREARKRGYAPDSSVCASDVPAGRPEPWMCLQNAMNLRIYPPEAMVKVGDTIPDIEEGLNAGMWTIGLAKTGNEVGLNQQEIADLKPQELKTRLERAYQRMYQAGAHYVVDSIGNVPSTLDLIEDRLSRGEYS